MAAASATCMANSTGWTRSIPVTVSGADIASVTENPGLAGDQWFHLRDTSGERRLTCQQARAHRRPLRPLTGEHPYRSPVVLAHRGQIRSVALGDLAQTARPAPPGSRRPRRCAPAGAHAGAPRCRRDRMAPRSSAWPSTHSASRREVRRSSSAEVAESANSSWLRQGW